MRPIEPLSPTKKGGFEYGSKGFTVHGISSVNGQRLCELCSPDTIKGKRLQNKARADAKATIKKPWLISQLRHYGIDFDTKATVGALTEALRESVQQGKCDKVPVTISELESQLAMDYRPKNAAHMAEKQKARDVEFSRLNNATEEAEYDEQMFLQKYFLTEDGMPCMTKTPDPIPLPGLSSRAAVHQAAERISGLETVSGGKGEGRTLVIGWKDGRRSVWQVASQIDKASSTQLKKLKATKWEKRLNEHRAFVKKLQKSPAQPAFLMSSTVGEYIIDFKMAEGYDVEPSDFSLGIIEGAGETKTAMFEFGPIEGMMYLDTDRQRLLEKCLDADEDSESDEDENEEDDHDEDDEDEDEASNDIQGHCRNRKRRQASSPSSTSAPLQKRSKPSSSPPSRRVFLQWRGRETGEGEIQLDQNQWGHLDFADNACTKFEGRISFDLLGENLPFTGYKVSNDGGDVTERWSDLSESAHAYAAKARWGSRW